MPQGKGTLAYRPSLDELHIVQCKTPDQMVRGLFLLTNIVADLVESGMSDARIMKNIGMDAEELLRLKQISGLASLFKDKEFSHAWG